MIDIVHLHELFDGVSLLEEALFAFSEEMLRLFFILVTD